MKKNYFIFVFALCSGFISLAQPVITTASFQQFSVASRNVPDFTGVTVGSAGANQPWDYSNLVTDPASVYFQTISQSEAPALPINVTIDPNYFFKVSAIFDDVIYQNFSFAKLGPNSYENLGNIDFSGEFEGYIDTPLIPLPLNYNDSYIDTVQRDSDPTPSSSTVTYDAYGTLATPFEQFTNVVRLKSVEDEETSYNWYKSNPFTPLMSIDVSNSTGLITNVVIWQNSPGLGVNEAITTNAKISVFPNPTNSILNLQLPNNTTIDRITITDLTGKIVKDQTQNTNLVNVESLANGIYILQGFSGDDTFETKFVKQ